MSRAASADPHRRRGPRGMCSLPKGPATETTAQGIRAAQSGAEARTLLGSVSSLGVPAPATLSCFLLRAPETARLLPSRSPSAARIGQNVSPPKMIKLPWAFPSRTAGPGQHLRPEESHASQERDTEPPCGPGITSHLDHHTVLARGCPLVLPHAGGHVLGPHVGREIACGVCWAAAA